MTRGEGSQTKVHHKGKLDDYVVFIDDVTAYKKWLTDKSIRDQQEIIASTLWPYVMRKGVSCRDTCGGTACLATCVLGGRLNRAAARGRALRSRLTRDVQARGARPV